MTEKLPTIGQHFQFPSSGGDVGLEIEAEFLELRHQNEVINDLHEGRRDKLVPWRTVVDHSLRFHGAEFVSDPLPIGAALVELSRILHVLTSRAVKNSPRCSFHVHCNVRDLTPCDLWKVLYAAWVLEMPMMQKCGVLRQDNLFCRRSIDAQGVLFGFAGTLNNQTAYAQNINLNTYKYSNINVASIGRLGTIEFRGMNGHLDERLYLDWTQACHNIVSKVSSHPDLKEPADVLRLFYRNPRDFVSDIIGSSFLYEEMENDVRPMLVLLSSVIASTIPWSTLEAQLIEERKVNKTPSPARRRPASSVTGSTIQTITMMDDIIIRDNF